MGAHLNELEHVEQELAELKNHMKQSFGVLDDLIIVQTQFEDVAQTYQKLKAYVDEARTIYTSLEAEARAILERISQAQEILNQNFAELERANEAKWGEFRGELLDVQNELHTAHRNLRTELRMQVTTLKGEIEKRLEEFSKSWEGYKESVQASLDEFETRITAEVETLNKLLDNTRTELGRQVNTLKGEVEERLEEFSKSWEDYKKSVQASLNEFETSLTQRFVELERANESKWAEFRNELLDVQNELHTAHRNLRDELRMQVNTLKGEVEERLEEFSKSWEGYRKSVQASLNEFETRLTTKVETLKNSLDQVRIDTDQRFNSLHKWVIVAISMGLSALGLTVWLFLTRL